VTALEGEYINHLQRLLAKWSADRPGQDEDFRQVERFSLITGEADIRNVYLSEKFDGLYAPADRPHSEIAPWSDLDFPILRIYAIGANLSSS